MLIRTCLNDSSEILMPFISKINLAPSKAMTNPGGTNISPKVTHPQYKSFSKQTISSYSTFGPRTGSRLVKKPVRTPHGLLGQRGSSPALCSSPRWWSSLQRDCLCQCRQSFQGRRKPGRWKSALMTCFQFWTRHNFWTSSLNSLLSALKLIPP